VNLGPGGTAAIVRSLLLIGLLLVGALLVATHGLRGLAVVLGLLVIWSVTQTRLWQSVEGVLVRLTGSRTRAAVLVLGTVLAIAVAVNLYEYLR
jgi:hypothetical protein